MQEIVKIDPSETPSQLSLVADEDRGININDVYVDENGLVYAIDRFKGGLYILELNV